MFLKNERVMKWSMLVNLFINANIIDRTSVRLMVQVAVRKS